MRKVKMYTYISLILVVIQHLKKYLFGAVSLSNNVDIDE